MCATTFNLLLLLAILAAGTDHTHAAPLNDSRVHAPAAFTNASFPLGNATAVRRPATIPDRHRTSAPERYFYGRQLMHHGCVHNLGTGRCLDVDQSNKQPLYADAQMWRCNLDPRSQKLQFYGRLSSFLIANIDAEFQYCLDVAEGKAFNGQYVRWFDCNDTPAQLWIYNSEYGFISPVLNQGLCLDPVGGNTKSHDGQGMQLWNCVQGETGHKWILDGDFSSTSKWCNR